MGVHASYNPNSGAALLSIGVLDSISAGILIYGGIVECLYHDVGSSFLRAQEEATADDLYSNSLCTVVSHELD